MFAHHQIPSGSAHTRRKARGTKRSFSVTREMRLEVLEERQLLTAAPVGELITVGLAGDSNSVVPLVAMDADGDSVVVWNAPNTDGNGYGILAQRYDAVGSPVGSQFVVNTFTTGDQTLPRVAMNDTGAFVVIWHSAGQDGSSRGVYGQRFDASGASAGGEFRVNTTTVGDQRCWSFHRKLDD